MVLTTATWLSAAALSLALVAVLLALGAFRRSGRGQPSGDADMAEALGSGEPVEALRLAAESIEALRRADESAALELARLAERQRLSVAHAGVVRFDALEEHTGELSFSLALLDDTRTGVVITSINGRQQTRVYAKSVKDGQPSVMLSDEERLAVQKALEPR